MRLVQFAAILLISASACHNAIALTVDENTAVNGKAATQLGDPDDKIPFPHVSDDGQSSDNYQTRHLGNSGVSYGFGASSGDNQGAFERAQQRMQQ